MPVTLFDLIVVGVILFSAVLAMIRGFSREVLAILAWGLSAVIAYFGYPFLQSAFEGFLGDARLAIGGAFAVIFLVALVIFSFLTTRLADFVIDSRAGVLDRSLGFVFGLFRGLLILVVAVAFWNWLVGDAQSPDWITNAKSKPVFDSLAAKLETLLPGGNLEASSLYTEQERILAMADKKVVAIVPDTDRAS